MGGGRMKQCSALMWPRRRGWMPNRSSLAVLTRTGFLVLLAVAITRAGPSDAKNESSSSSASPDITSIARSVDASDPSTTISLIRPVDPRRIGAAHVTLASAEDVEASRSALPCQNIAYQN